MDQLLPGRLCAYYVVGSIALGAYRPLRSDIDFVAVLDGEPDETCLRRLRAAQIVTGLTTASRALAQRQLALPGTCNGVFITEDQVGRPVSTIAATASQTAHRLRRGEAFDVNPVVWKVLAERGIALRGHESSTLPLDPEPETLRPWTLANLNGYWRRCAEATLRARPPMSRLLPRPWVAAWGVLGVPRLHATVATGDVLSKEAAGEYALDRFDQEWHPLIREALAYWREEPPRWRSRHRPHRPEAVGEFMLHVIDDANGLMG